VNYYTILPLFAFGFCSILGLLVLWRNHCSSVHRLFSLFLFGMGLWGFVIFGMRASPDTTHALPWEQALMPIGALVGVSFWYFSFTYTRAKPKGRYRTVAVIFLLLIIALSPTRLFVKGIGADAYGYFPISGPLFYFAAVSLYLFIVLGLVNLLRAYRTSTLYEKRNRYLYIVIGLVLCMLGGVADAVGSLGMPVPPGGIIGNILFCSLATVAILKYHLLDIHIIVRKGVAYLLMSSIVAIPYVGVVILFNHLFGIGNIPLWAHFLLLLLLAFVLQILWRRGQRWVDRWFYQERYDFLRELEHFSQETHDISDLKQLGSSLVKLISQALQASSVHLLLLSESGDFNVVFSIGENTAQLTLESNSPLLRWLQSNRGLLHHRDLDTIPQLQSLTAKERSELENTGVELFTSLKTKKDELVGLLLLGKKLSQQPYSEEDRHLVSTVADRVAIELENARLYDSERTMRAELEKRDEQKTEFLHSVGHELKTPLTAIISSSELLSEDSSTSHKLRERLIANIRTSANSMNRRVTELLDLAQMQIGGLKIESEPLEMSHAITEVASQLRILFEKKEQALTLEIPDSLSRVNADKGKLEQVLFNLLSNANKFSPAGSDITLRAREVDRRIIVEVEDSAPVVTEREKTKLFDAYYRGEDTGKGKQFPGLGLGLAISKKLVELHGGEIWVESKRERGNTFAFSLPALDKRTNEIK